MAAGLSLGPRGKLGLAAGLAAAAGLRLLQNNKAHETPSETGHKLPDFQETPLDLMAKAPAAPEFSDAHSQDISPGQQMAEDDPTHDISLKDATGHDFSFPLGPLIWEEGTDVISQSPSLGDTVWYQPYEPTPAPEWAVAQQKVLESEVPYLDLDASQTPSKESLIAPPADVGDANLELIEQETSPDTITSPLLPGVAEPPKQEPDHPAIETSGASLPSPLMDGHHVPRLVTAKSGSSEIVARTKPLTSSPEPRHHAASSLSPPPQTRPVEVPVGDGFGLHGLSPEPGEPVLTSRLHSHDTVRPTPSSPGPCVHRSVEPLAPTAPVRKKRLGRVVFTMFAVVMMALFAAAGLWRNGELLERVRQMEWKHILSGADVATPAVITAPQEVPRTERAVFVSDLAPVK